MIIQQKANISDIKIKFEKLCMEYSKIPESTWGPYHTSLGGLLERLRIKGIEDDENGLKIFLNNLESLPNETLLKLYKGLKEIKISVNDNNQSK